MDASAQLDLILAGPEGEDLDPSRAERVEELIEAIGWSSVCGALDQVLEDAARPLAHYEVVAEVLWGAVLDGRAMDADRVIAQLLHRLQPAETAENNLVWSIAAELKGEDYLSTYQPRDDPGVARHLRRLEGGTA